MYWGIDFIWLFLETFLNAEGTTQQRCCERGHSYEPDVISRDISKCKIKISFLLTTAYPTAHSNCQPLDSSILTEAVISVLLSRGGPWNSKMKENFLQVPVVHSWVGSKPGLSPLWCGVSAHRGWESTWSSTRSPLIVNSVLLAQRLWSVKRPRGHRQAHRQMRRRTERKRGRLQGEDQGWHTSSHSG